MLEGGHAVRCACFRERRNEVFIWNGGYRYRGYGEIVVRHFLHPKEPLVHPLPNL